MSLVRHLWVDLDVAASGQTWERSSWRAPDGLAELEGWGGSAAALANLGSGHAGLQLAVGPGVVRGLPTAARLHVVGRSPLTGRPAEGLVGSAIGPVLASQVDLVQLSGRVDLPGAVLVIEDGGARLITVPELVGAAVDDVGRALEALLGPCEVLRVGPAAEAGVRWANLAAGSSPTSFVGRGGLGARLADHGLKAIAALGHAVTTDGAHALVARMTSSPRLLERAAGGTFELAGARAAQGDLPEEAARRMGTDLGAAREGRYGCRGCPTPCGWTFDRGKRSLGAHFSAVHALGVALGLEATHALDLLARCNEFGLDAKEAGAALLLGVELGLARPGEVDELDDLLARMARGEWAAAGVAAAARHAGRPDPTRRGEAVRAESNLAAQLGMHVAVRGVEPMRVAPFLVGAGADAARLERALGSLGLPEDATDPQATAGKGTLVWAHENLAIAVDLIGFCAFTTAGLLADGVVDLNGLAGALEPGLTGAGLLRRGAVGAACLAMAGEPWTSDVPDGLAGEAARYRALRGIGAAGEVSLGPRAVLAAPLVELAEGAPEARAEAASAPAAGGTRGRVHLHAGGLLGRHLGEDPVVELDLPAPIRVVLAQAAQRWPAAGPFLLDGERVLPAVHRRGVLLRSGDAIQDGEHLELVLAISGG